MARIVRFYLSIFGLQILLISAATFSFAQVDPTKALVGTWEGHIAANLSGGSGRTLIINSVKPQGEGEWVARGRFTFSGQANTAPGGQEMSVSKKDNDIFVEFVAGNSKNPVRLKLVGDNKLEGTINTQSIGQKRPSDQVIKFEKVETKAGEVK